LFHIVRTVTRFALLASLASTAAYLYPAARLTLRYALPDTREEASIDAALLVQGKSSVSEEIRKALSQDDPELARSFANLASDRSISVDPELLARIDEAERFDLGRSAGELWSGFVSGEADTPTAFAASLAADLSVAGDVRDLYRELSAYPDYDELTVGLAAVGLAATGATVASGLNALPAKAGVSLLKTAKKAGKISPALTSELKDIATRSIDTREAAAVVASLRTFDAASAASAGRRIVRPDVIRKLGDTATSLGGIAGKQGYRGTLQTLDLASSTGDIARFERISEKFGNSYRAVLRIAAKTGALALKAGKFAVLMMWWLGGMLMWALGALMLAAEFFLFARSMVGRSSKRSPDAASHFSTNA
jgi:hypothetical protein